MRTKERRNVRSYWYANMIQLSLAVTQATTSLAYKAKMEAILQPVPEVTKATTMKMMMI